MARSMIIVGGGLAGLSAGCYGRMNGYRTSIYEMHSKAGGVCTNWKRHGYTIDGAMNTLAGTRPGTSLHAIWEELGAAQRWQIVNHDQYILIEDQDGKVLTISSNIDRLEENLIEYAPEDSDFIRECCNAARESLKIDLPVDKPQELFSLVDYIKMMKLMPLFRFIRKWGSITSAEYNKRFRNQFLRKAFAIRPETEFLEMPVINILMELGWLHQKDAGYVVGGAMALVNYIQERYRDLGGELHLNAKVAKILVENDRAVGIRLTDGTEHRGDIVISAADGHATIFDMLDGKYADDKIRGYFRTLPLRPPLVYVALGVDRTFNDVPSSVEGLTFPLAEPIAIAGKEHHMLGAQFYNFDPTMAPEGKTVVRTYFNTDYDYWEKLHREPGRYEAEKERIAESVIAALDRRFPGLAGQVEMRDVATPMTWVRYTGNWRGAYEGWMMTPRTFMLQMSKTLPRLDNFYMAGQWVMPGGGMITAAISGRQTMQIICKNDEKTFEASTP